MDKADQLADECDSSTTIDKVFHTVVRSTVRWPPAARAGCLAPRIAGAVYVDEQVELAFGSLHLGNIDVEEADRITLEALPLRLATFDIRQTRDAVPLEARMQR